MAVGDGGEVTLALWFRGIHRIAARGELSSRAFLSPDSACHEV